MRSTAAWTPGTKYNMDFTFRQRYPNFNWRNGSSYYTLSGLGEDWGDSPGTVKETRERSLSTRYQYGGFAVANDSVQLSNGNILRVTSLPACNQGSNIWWKEVSSTNDLGTAETLTFTSSPRVWTGVGLAEHSDPLKARMFFIRTSDNKLVYQDYESGVGWGSVFAYSGSPSFNFDGVAIAPVSETKGFVITYNPTGHQVTLHCFDNGTWTSYKVSMRYPQHFLNCHWFDAVTISADQTLITFNVNGTQYVTIHNQLGFWDPWPIVAFDPEFGGAQTRVCKLAKFGNRVIATGWSRFSGSSNDYEVSYYHLLWSDNYVHWAMPEDGYMGQVSCRGKLHLIDDIAYVIGSSVSYVGDAVSWLGGSVGSTNNASVVVKHNLVQDINKASDIKLDCLIPEDFDKSLFTYGNDLVCSIQSGSEPAVVLSTLTLDTPGNSLIGSGENMSLVARGPLKKMITFRTPMDQTYSGAEAYHADFRIGNLYTRSGTWSHDTSGVAYCERHEGTEAIATVGVQYDGQFQISTRLRITKSIDTSACGVVFWYEGPQDYYRVQLSGSSISLRKYVAATETVLSTASVTGGFVADTWYDLLLIYQSGTLKVYIRPSTGSWQNAISFSSWSDAEPLRWYAGLFCKLPATRTTVSLSYDATHKVDVSSTTDFPSSGDVKVNNEIISYSSKTDIQFGTGNAYSVIRGVRSTRVSHPVGSTVTVADKRFESSSFSVFQEATSLSVASACSQVITTTGVPVTSSFVVNNSDAGNRVFPELHSHGWVLNGISYEAPFTMYFWCDTNNPPQSGIKVYVTTTEIILSDVVGGEIIRYPISIASSALCRFRVEKNTIFFWVNGQFIVALYIPGDNYRVGAVACDGGIITLAVNELFEPAEGIVWNMRESAREVLNRLLEGRDAYLVEKSDGSINVTLLEDRDNLGSLNGNTFVSYQKQANDQEWASAMIAWGGEEWVLVMEPDADRLRWTEWQTPHIYDRITLRHRAMRRLRKLYALKDLRVIQGPFDPRIEIGDEVYIESIRGVPDGYYLIRSIEVMGDNKQVDMQVTLQALPDMLETNVWPITPGISRPTEGL